MSILSSRDIIEKKTKMASDIIVAYSRKQSIIATKSGSIVSYTSEYRYFMKVR